MAIKPKQAVEAMEPFGSVAPPSELAKEIGVDRVVRLTLNENLYGPSPKVRETVAQWLTTSHGSNYPDPRLSELRDTIASRYHLDSQQIVFTNGLDEMIQLLARTFIQPGDEVIAQFPTFPEYQSQTEVDGAIFKAVQTVEGFIDWNATKDALGEKTKLIFICNPNNPTGTYEALDTVRDFIEYATEKAPHTLIVVDEAYYEFTGLGDDQSAISLLEEFPQLAVMRTFSKAYSLANIRCGYTLFAKDTAYAVDSVRMPFNLSDITQVAALAAYEDQAYLQRVVEQTSGERERWYQLFNELGIKYYPSWTNFIMFQSNKAEALVEHAQQSGFLLTTHTYPDWIRLTLPTATDGKALRQLVNDFYKNT